MDSVGRVPRVFGEQQSELGGVGSGRDEGQIGARKQGRWAGARGAVLSPWAQRRRRGF